MTIGPTLFDSPIPVFEARPPSSSLSGAAPGPTRTRAILPPPGLGTDCQGLALSDPPFSSSCSEPLPDHRCPVLFGDEPGSHPEHSLQRSTDGPTHYDPSAPVFKARPRPTSLLGAAPGPNLNPGGNLTRGKWPGTLRPAARQFRLRAPAHSDQSEVRPPPTSIDGRHPWTDLACFLPSHMSSLLLTPLAGLPGQPPTRRQNAGHTAITVDLPPQALFNSHMR